MNRTLTAIVALGLALRLLLLVGAPYPAQDDTRTYLGIAVNVVNGWGYSFDNDFDGIPEISSREPGYPTFLAGLYAVSPEHALQLAGIIQVALSGLAIVAVFSIGRALISPAVGLWGAGLYAVWPGLVVETIIPGHEGLLISAFPLIFWLLLRAQQTESWRRYAVLGLMIGLAALVKQTVVGVPACLALGLVAAAPRSVPRWRGAAVMVLGFVLAIAPWIVRSVVINIRARALVQQLMPDANETSTAAYRATGLKLHHGVMREIRGGAAAGSPTPAPTPAPAPVRIETGQGNGSAPKDQDATLLARVTYDFYESDPRRGVPMLSGSGGDVQALISRPRALIGRIASNLNTAGRPVFFVPYENRYVDFVLPSTLRLSEWRRSGSGGSSAGVLVKLTLVALLAMMHVFALAGALRLSMIRKAWPLLIVLLYFYVMPMIHSGPLNRFFFVATPLALVFGAVAVEGARQAVRRSLSSHQFARCA